METKNQVLKAKRETAFSLLFICLETLYNIELDEQGNRVELDLDECPFNQEVLEALRNAKSQLKGLYS